MLAKCFYVTCCSFCACSSSDNNNLYNTQKSLEKNNKILQPRLYHYYFFSFAYVWFFSLFFAKWLHKHDTSVETGSLLSVLFCLECKNQSKSKDFLWLTLWYTTSSMAEGKQGIRKKRTTWPATQWVDGLSANWYVKGYATM